jgi:HTH-type transcriptional regulator/antitoxin HigA
MMRALNKGLGIPSEVLLQEPNALLLEDGPRLEWEKFPIKEMVKKGWIAGASDVVTEGEEIIRDLINNAGGLEAVGCCLFRRSKGARENTKNDSFALTAWCLKILEIANSKGLSNQYAEGSVNDVFLRETARLSYFYNGPALAKEYLEKHGINLIILEHLSKTYLDGAVIFPSNKNPVIGLTLRYDRLDNFWFCLLHELAHLSKHMETNDSGIIIDDLDLRKYDDSKEDSLERQADSIAKEALIPSEEWATMEFSSESGTRQTQIIEFAQKLKINPAVLAGRIRFETNNYRRFSNLLGHGEVSKHFSDN